MLIQLEKSLQNKIWNAAMMDLEMRKSKLEIFFVRLEITKRPRLDGSQKFNRYIYIYIYIHTQRYLENEQHHELKHYLLNDSLYRIRWHLLS